MTVTFRKKPTFGAFNLFIYCCKKLPKIIDTGTGKVPATSTSVKGF